MIEYIIAFAIILITFIYFTFSRSSTSTTDNTAKNNSKKDTKSKNNAKNNDKNTTNDTSKTQTKSVDNKSYILNHFREGKVMQNPYVSSNGKTILFHDDKRICLCYLDSILQKNPKFYTKTVEQDVISDASYSEDKK